MSASLNFQECIMMLAPAPKRRIGFMRQDNPTVPEVSVPLPDRETDPERVLILDMADAFEQLASMFDRAKRLRMLTRREDHIEFSDSQARYLAQTLRGLAERAKERLAL